jgi:hypothetical protein
MTTRRDRFVADMLAWLNQRLAPPGVVVESGTALFASGMITSIKVLELIAFTERAIGQSIPDHQIKLANFHSVDRIADVFVKERTHANV